MKSNSIALIISLILLSSVNLVSAETNTNKLVYITSTSDSHMRPYLETTYGNVPSAGHYTYWAVQVQSVDYPKWVNIGFIFDNKKEIVHVYVVPQHKTYIYANGYMKTFTNKVNVTQEPPYN